MISPTDITARYTALADAKRHYAAAATEEIAAERALEDARLRAIADGRITGKNEAERAASAQTVLADLIEAHRAAQDCARAARLEMDLAALDVEALRAELRLMELAEGEVRHD